MRTTWKQLSNETKPLTFLLALTFLFLLGSSSVVFGDEIQDGFDAYKKKDYKEAVMFFHLSAEQGDALAQLLLGLMYDEGKGAAQDYVEAVKWYRRSAELGNASAQNNLGFMYAQGQGVLKDYVIAHMWFNLSFSWIFVLVKTLHLRQSALLKNVWYKSCLSYSLMFHSCVQEK